MKIKALCYEDRVCDHKDFILFECTNKERVFIYRCK